MKVLTVIIAAAGAAVLELPPLTDADLLEESVQNEVDHALYRAPTNAPPVAATNDIFGIEGLSASDAAIRLVSAQSSDGRWLAGTNDVTAAAVEALQRLSSPDCDQ